MPEQPPTDEERLQARLAANLRAADEAMEAARAEPWVNGSMGQKRPHPGWAVAAACDALVLELEARLTALREAREQEEELAKGLTTDPRLR